MSFTAGELHPRQPQTRHGPTSTRRRTKPHGDHDQDRDESTESDG